MNHYETVYIIHPAIQEGRLNDIVSKFKDKIESHKGKFLYVENWGKKKLLINKNMGHMLCVNIQLMADL